MIRWHGHPMMLRVARRVARRIGLEPIPLDPRRLAYVLGRPDPQTSQPTDASAHLARHRDRLLELQDAYAAFDHPLGLRSNQWSDDHIEAHLSMASFRVHGLIMSQRLEVLELARLRFTLLATHARRVDHVGFLDVLDEDGQFGAWTFEVEGIGLVSRDLLDSVLELTFLADHTDVLSRGRRVLDIGAGYGRLAHRAAVALPGLLDYACVDAVPQSTFLCDFYTSHRGVRPPVRVLALPEIVDVPAGSFDLAVNVHSFSEAPLAAIAAWLDELVRLDVADLFLVPNHGRDFRSKEPDGRRRDFRHLLDERGFELVADRPAITDVAVRSALQDVNHHFLFRRPATNGRLMQRG